MRSMTSFFPLKFIKPFKIIIIDSAVATGRTKDLYYFALTLLSLFLSSYWLLHMCSVTNSISNNFFIACVLVLRQYQVQYAKYVLVSYTLQFLAKNEKIFPILYQTNIKYFNTILHWHHKSWNSCEKYYDLFKRPVWILP